MSTLTPEQCRAARALLGWSQTDLEINSGVARKTIADFEGGKKQRPYGQTLEDLKGALETGGTRFVDPNGEGEGVRLRQAIWKLTPLDLTRRNWTASTHKGEVVIRAATEDRARRIASLAFAIAVKKGPPGEDTILNPWGRIIGEASCERLTDSEYPEDGRDEILDPAEHDREWRP